MVPEREKSPDFREWRQQRTDSSGSDDSESEKPIQLEFNQDGDLTGSAAPGPSQWTRGRRHSNLM